MTERVPLTKKPRVRVIEDEPKAYAFPVYERVPPDPDRGRGRPQHMPCAFTRRQVSLLSAFGHTHDEIGYIIGIGSDTLIKYYKDELKHGLAKQNATVAMRLYDIATRGQGKEALSAMIFWLKTRAGWRETIAHEGTIRHEHDHEHTINRQLTHEGRAARVLQLLNAGGVSEARLVVTEREEPVASPAGPADAGLSLPG